MIKFGIHFALLATILASASCGSPNHAAGQACGSNADCVTGLICATEDVNGQCIKTCTPSMDSACTFSCPPSATLPRT